MAHQANLALGLLALAVLIALVNVAVCVAVIRSGYYTSAQISAQVAIVWLVPVLGAIGVGMFLRSQRGSSVPAPRPAAFLSDAANVEGAPGPGGGQHAP